MARRGDTIEHPVTGERITFLETSEETDGKYATFELRVRPHGFVVAPHVHPFAEETFEIRSGTFTFVVDGHERRAGPGDGATVPAGAVHAWWKTGEDEGIAVVEFRPALKTEEFFESFFGLAEDGAAERAVAGVHFPHLPRLRAPRQAAAVRATRRLRSPRRRGAAARLPAAAPLPLRARATPRREGCERGGRNVGGRSVGGRTGRYPHGRQAQASMN